MNDFWNWLVQIWDSVEAFIKWYFNDTPLFNDTLDDLYAIAVYSVRELKPLIEEYIQYIGEYLKG